MSKLQELQKIKVRNFAGQDIESQYGSNMSEFWDLINSMLHEEMERTWNAARESEEEKDGFFKDNYGNPLDVFVFETFEQWESKQEKI